MTLCRRLIVCLDVTGDRVVKGVRFADLRDVGDPVALAARYEAEGADEIVFLDVSATIEQRTTLLECVRRTAERLFIPLLLEEHIPQLEVDIGDAGFVPEPLKNPERPLELLHRLGNTALPEMDVPDAGPERSES